MGPLAGIRVLEFEAIGPGPFCGMLLADMGADVLLVDRESDPAIGLLGERRHETMLRGRRSLTLDLKAPQAVEAAVLLASKADAVIEGFRPGVMERLGLGPDTLLAANPRLVYARMTGWGQSGPLASRAGHDIDYIALAGVLNAVGHEGARPVPPLNLVGDFGGGGMLLAFGIACALVEAQASGRGQVIDAAMIDGAGLLSTLMWGLRAAHRWSDTRGVNVLDSGAPWYDTYATRDGGFFAVGAIEPRFYGELLQRLGLADEPLPAQHDRSGWPVLRERFARAFAQKTRAEWERVFADGDACTFPVLSFAEAAEHPHAVARGAHVEVDGVLQPAPAPRFSRTPAAVPRRPPERRQHGREALEDWGFDAHAIARLRGLGAGFD